MSTEQKDLTPPEIVAQLDQHIIGQAAAKRAVANALRNRWRRQRVAEHLRHEITPKNILMIGPTGVGKTEIARRLAKLANAPFLKVEATKYTEVGYVGRDVESMVRDLVEASVKQTREMEMDKVRQRAQAAAENRILDVLLPPARDAVLDETTHTQGDSPARQMYREKLRSGELNQQEIQMDVSSGLMGVEIMAPPGMEEMTSQLQGLFQSLSNEKRKPRTLRVDAALKMATEEEAAKLVNEDEIRTQALMNAEQNGIIFIDEIDKITARNDHSGAGVSREGVQRDLLPLVEGCNVTTKYGTVKTDHVLFIASGAFQLAKPSDLVPELQGRLPIRVELEPLVAADFERILTEPNACLTEQYCALLQTEGVTLEFKKEGIQRIAEIAWQVNERMENIGARRLHTVMERLLEALSYDASDLGGQKVVVDKAYVDKQVGELSQDEDLSQYIL